MSNQRYFTLKVVAMMLWWICGNAVYVAMASSDDFKGYVDGQIVTDYTTYNYAPFPNGGSSGPNNPSKLWEAGSGWLYADEDGQGDMWGYSGKPNDWPDKFFFRLNTQDTARDQVVSFNYKSAAFGADGFPVEGSDAVDIWLRYQTQYWLYALQFDRPNNCMFVKRKVPSNDNGQWGGPSSLISNKGVYYTLYTDADQPIHGAGFQCITWAGVGMPNLAHNGTSSGGTVYSFEATIKTIQHSPFDYVQIQLRRGGTLVGSWVDDNTGTNANGFSFQSDWNAGYFNNVSGFTQCWGFPIYAVGKSGLRGDNIKVWFDDWFLTEAGGPQCPADIAPSPNGDGTVNVDDLLAVINSWGNCPDAPGSCVGDIVPPGSCNGAVDVDDLLAVINSWGDCP